MKSSLRSFDKRTRSIALAAIPGVGFGLSNYVQNAVIDPPFENLFLMLAGPAIFVVCFLVGSLAIFVGYRILDHKHLAPGRVGVSLLVQAAYFLTTSVVVFAALAFATTLFRMPNQFGQGYFVYYREIALTCLPVWAAVYSACVLLMLRINRGGEDNPSNAGDSGRLTIKADRRIYSVPLDDISFLRAQGNYVEIACKSRCITARRSLGSLECVLPEAMFIRIHRSFVVRKAAIAALYNTDSRRPEIELNDGTRLPVGRNRFDQIRLALAPIN
ncbi:LytR/AlgR family response regulator transcription factor [Hyphobacterium sp.]|uniref:LytR/AlgR family response regulator transcription factor n=1 Tax=Hyphobacterium sp. TaxID=2004662 RepID=UPI0037490286